jgi:DNA-binding transcriptional LysR family regulator
MAKIAATQGSGLVYLNEDLIDAEIKSGELQLVLNSFASVSSGFYLYFPKRSQIQPNLRAFIDHVKGTKPSI